VIELVIK